MGQKTDIKKKNVDQNVDQNVILKMNKDITYEKIYLNAFEIAMQKWQMLKVFIVKKNYKMIMKT
jgi:hypothetical protein